MSYLLLYRLSNLKILSSRPGYTQGGQSQLHTMPLALGGQKSTTSHLAQIGLGTGDEISYAALWWPNTVWGYGKWVLGGCLGPCLGQWSYHSLSPCWCLWPKLPKGCVATWAHSVIQAWAVTKCCAWIHDPGVALVCVGIHGSCYQQR